MTRRVAILLFDAVEVLDFAGPLEVFAVAARLHARARPDEPAPFEAFTVSRSLEAIQTRCGLRVLPTHDFASCGHVDILVVPGGVVDAEMSNDVVIDWIAATAGRCECVASVCTGAFLLAKTGLLDDKRATTHWEDLQDLARLFPKVQVIERTPWTVHANVFTSAGISAGISMSLEIVARLIGRAAAHAVARQMEYRWEVE